ncbi:alpha/beta hydrolase [Actinophytocola sp.]|uniref:alpha/beta hydrolase n=1 Tax=Actinophytocola sp. TaxID=1872138 RepID=UPI002ED493B7
MSVYTDIPYAAADPEGSRGHLLDLYVPAGQGRRPLLIVMGGSAWLGDNGKAYAAQLAPHFTAAGYVVAGVSTRSSAQTRFPGQLHDVKAAIRWLRVHAREYGIDPARFAVLGDSSGGWTATMAGVTGEVRGLEGDVGVTGVSSRVQAVVDLYGPTDFLVMDAHMLPGACESFNELMGVSDCHNDVGSPESRLVGCAIQTCPDRVWAANPIRYVTPGAPPFLIAHGQQDLLVPHHQSELLYAALKRACVAATFFSVPGVGHSKNIVSPDNAESDVRSTVHCRDTTPPATRPTLDTIESFLDSALRVRAGAPATS